MSWPAAVQRKKLKEAALSATGTLGYRCSTILWSLVFELLKTDGYRDREKIYLLNVMHQTALQGTFLGLKIQSLEQTSFLTARTVQISQKQGCLSDLSKANVNLFCHPHSGFSLAKVPEGSWISAHHFLSLILQPYRHQSQRGSVTSSRCVSDKGL